jgi:hypothetical protein
MRLWGCSTSIKDPPTLALNLIVCCIEVLSGSSTRCSLRRLEPLFSEPKYGGE